jgi:hypothetical protein
MKALSAVATWVSVVLALLVGYLLWQALDGASESRLVWGLYLVVGYVGLVFAGGGFWLGYGANAEALEELRAEREKARELAERHAAKAYRYDWLIERVTGLEACEVATAGEEGKEKEWVAAQQQKVEEHNKRLQQLKTFLQKQW